MYVSQKITDILNYYQNNPGCDPNMHEFVRLCYDMAFYLIKEAPNYGIHPGSRPVMKDGQPVLDDEGNVLQEFVSKEQCLEKYPVACAIYEKFVIFSKQLEEKLLGNSLGITKESPLHRLYEESVTSVGTYATFEDTPLREKLAGVTLFIAQKKREVAQGLIPDFKYDNPYEMADIERMSQQYPDPTLMPYYTKGEEEKETKRVDNKSARQLLIEQITEEFQRSTMTM